MARVVLPTFAAAVVALVLHYQPWAAATQTEEIYRAAEKPAVNLPSDPTLPKPAKRAEDSARASSLMPPALPVSAACPQAPGQENLAPPALPSPAQAPMPPPGGSADGPAKVVGPPGLPAPGTLTIPPPESGRVNPLVPPPGAAPMTPPSLSEGKWNPANLMKSETPPAGNIMQLKAQIPDQPPSPPPAVGIPTPPVAPGAAATPGAPVKSPPAFPKNLEIPPPPPLPGTTSEPASAVKPLTSPWSFHLEIVDGKNLITAKVGKTVQFRVVCEKLEIQSPVGSIHATGKVKIQSEALEVSCDRLTIQLNDEAVLLEGTARMKCQHEGKELDLRSDSLSLKLSDIQGGASKTSASYPLSPAEASRDHTGAVRPPIATAIPGPTKMP